MNYILNCILEVKPAMLNLVNVETGELTKLPIKKQKNNDYRVGRLILVKDGKPVTYAVQSKKLFQEYRQRLQFINLTKPHQEQYFSLLTTNNLSYKQFYIAALNKTIDVPEQICSKLKEKYTKTCTCTFRVNLNLYQKEVLTELDSIARAACLNIKWVEDSKFIVTLTYNALFEKPFTCFQRIFHDIKHIDYSTVEL